MEVALLEVILVLGLGGAFIKLADTKIGTKIADKLNLF